MAGSIFIPLISVFDAKGIRDAKTGMAALGGVVKNLRTTAVAAAGAFATVKAKEFVKESVIAARDLDRNMVGLGNVFEGLTPNMQQFAKDASAIGLSQVEASRASTFLGSVLKQSGFEMGTVAVETKNLVGLASDLAATYGYDVSEALTGMTALFRGEYDPIEKFGVAMKQSEVNAVLAARGQDKLTGAAQRNAQAQARLDILYQRSQDAQGAYAQQSGTLFTEQKNLAAAFENIKASVGASLTGPLATLLNSLLPIVEAVGVKLAPAFETLGRIVEMLTPLIQPIVDVFLLVNDALQPIIDLLLMLIEPLLIPLATAFELIGSIIKPFIPLITFLANVLGAILAPVIWVVTMGLRALTEGLQAIFEYLGKIPGFGEAFKDINAGLKSFSTGILDSTKQTGGLNKSINAMTSKLSKKLPTTSIDGVGKAADKAKTGINEALEALKQLLQTAQGIQSSIMGSFDINNVFDDVTDGIVESVIYVDGKFKTVVSGVSRTSKDIVAGFQDNLGKIKGFYRNLKLLIKAGLDPVLLKQITDAGPIAGAATAEAILASGQEGIDALSATSKEITKVSGDIGATVARALGESNPDIGNGLIDPIIAELKSLTGAAAAAGESAGKALVKGVTKAVKETAADQLSAGKISFNDFIVAISGGTPLPGEKTKKTPKYSNMSDLFKPKTDAFGFKLPALKPGANGMFSFKPLQINNPYDKSKQPGQFAAFELAQGKATIYNLSVNVPLGATDAEIGRTLIKKIQAFERSGGKTWRDGKNG
jgi:hypothetical protein